MPIIVFGISSKNSGHKNDTNLFLQKPYLRTKYIESKIEEDFDLKNQFRIKSLPDPISIRGANSKNFVGDKFNDPSVIKNSEHVDFNVKNVNNVRSFKVNSFPSHEEQLKPK